MKCFCVYQFASTDAFFFPWVVTSLLHVCHSSTHTFTEPFMGQSRMKRHRATKQCLLGRIMSFLVLGTQYLPNVTYYVCLFAWMLCRITPEDILTKVIFFRTHQLVVYNYKHRTPQQKLEVFWIQLDQRLLGSIGATARPRLCGCCR